MAEGYIPMTTNISYYGAVDGYCKMPDGTLIQWGRVRFPPATEIGVQYNSVNFPIEFSSTNIAVTVSWNDGFAQIDSFVGAVGVDAVTTQTARFACIRKQTTGNWYAKFIAIGRWK